MIGKVDPCINVPRLGGSSSVERHGKRNIHRFVDLVPVQLDPGKFDVAWIDDYQWTTIEGCDESAHEIEKELGAADSNT